MEQYFDPRGGSNRCKVNIDFFKKWSNEMAYVLGFLYADGDIVDASHSARTQYIKFASKDRSIIEKIKKMMQAEHKIYCRPAQKTLFNNGKIYLCAPSFSLRIGSKRMFADLTEIGLTPNKSKIVQFPKIIPNKHISHFIRGYFDGDGCVYIRRGRNKKNELVYRGLRIVFTCGNKEFLKDVSVHLSRRVGLTEKNIYDSKRSYQLCYSTSESIKMFKFLYKDTEKSAYLERKFNIFLRYFKDHPDKADGEIRNLLDNLQKWPGTQVARERFAKPFYASANLAQASR